MVNIDLHIHSTYSDGEVSPETILSLAKQKRISIFSITDHNFISPNVAYLGQELPQTDLKFIQGIEISTLDRESGKSLHILGYSTDFDISRLNNALSKTVDGYNNRAKNIILKLNKEYPGVNLDFYTIRSEVKEAYISRNTLSRKLRDFLKSPLSIKEISRNVYVEENSDWMLSPKEAIELIHGSRGIAVLAHPGKLLTKDRAMVEALVNRLSDYGLNGIEARYSSHTPEETDALLNLAEQNHLLVTAGSDWHGDTYSAGKVLGMEVPDNEAQAFIGALEKDTG